MTMCTLWASQGAAVTSDPSTNQNILWNYNLKSGYDVTPEDFHPVYTKCEW